MGLDLIAIGEGMVEFHAEGHGFSGDLFRRGFAGDVVNTLIHASRLGLNVALISRIGDDAFAPLLRKAWEAEGVDLSHAPVVPGDNGIYFILTDAVGEREFIYRRAGSAASGLGPADLDVAFLQSAGLVLLSGITQAISETAESLIRAASRLPVLTAYDPNYRPKLWARRGGIAAAQAAFADVAPHVRWIMPSYPADLVLIGAEENLPAAEALRRFAAFGPDVALKWGDQGVLLWVAGQISHILAAPVAEVVDSTGAGDAWNGAFLAGLVKGQPPEAAAALANAHAALTLAYRGAIPPR